MVRRQAGATAGHGATRAGQHCALQQCHMRTTIPAHVRDADQASALRVAGRAIHLDAQLAVAQRQRCRKHKRLWWNSGQAAGCRVQFKDSKQNDVILRQELGLGQQASHHSGGQPPVHPPAAGSRCR